MSNVMHRHWHACPECGQSWECFMPGDCRTEKEKGCRYCTVGDGEDDEEENEE